jgi:phage/plasmid-associated DNA primase
MTDTKTVPEKAKKYEGYASKQQTVSEFDLRDYVIENLHDIAHSGGAFRRYGDGVWRNVNELEIEKAVAWEMECAAAAGVLRPSYQMQRSITNAMKSKVYVREDEWDRRQDVIVFRNCALDIGSMGPIQHDPEHRSTVALPYDYDRRATAPTWERVIKDVLTEDERKFFQEFAGYCLTPSVRYQMALWL